MQTLAASVAQQLKKYGLQSEAYASLMLERMKQILVSHFGEEISVYAQPTKYTMNKLYIKCNNSLWKNEINRSKNQFIKILQAEFPNDEIKNIIIIS